jgi:DNA-binding PadR family transcriptional regulator
MRRVRDATEGLVSLAPGSLHPALRTLTKAGLVRSWKVVPGRERGGRSRTYFELTVAGIRNAELQAATLGRLLVYGRRAKTRVSASERRTMASRVERVAELFDLNADMRDSLAKPRARR